jgi:hypothetical protein
MKIHDRVLIPGDDGMVSPGTIAGTATVIADPNDPCSPFSEGGTVRNQFVVRLDFPHVGIIGRFVGDNEVFTPIEPRIEVDHILVFGDDLEMGPWYVNVYEVDQGYGGPEEGGWYYNTYSIQETVRCETYAEAERIRDELREGKWADEPDARVSSVVYSGGVYSLVIEATVGEDSNTYQPYC